MAGFGNASSTLASYPAAPNSTGYDFVDGNLYGAGAGAQGATLAAGDIMGIALDVDAGTADFYKNNVKQGSTLTHGITGTLFALVTSYDVSGNVNFGQRPFAYTAPSGYKALCTANLPDPTIADGSTAMDVVTYTGNGSTQSITGLGFSPDLVWCKRRSGVANHHLYDIVRGATERLQSSTTSAESTAVGGVTSFDSDGWTMGNDADINGASNTFVGWTWDGGSSTVTNTDGSISSQVRANPSAGFSIVSYTGNATAGATIGHGLNASPSLVIIKNRDTAVNWVVGHVIPGFTKYLELNTTLLATTASSIWNNTDPTSALVTLGSDTLVNQNTGNHIAYCFAPVEGYSAFGSYTGNGSADGPFVFTGFRPRWILIKRSSGTASGYWGLFDTERSTYNVVDDYIWANDSSAELSGLPIDVLSNGFKPRAADSNINQSTQTHIYAAFAEHPFKTSRAR